MSTLVQHQLTWDELIVTLDPRFMPYVQAAVREFAARGLEVLPIEGRRPIERQLELYAIGRRRNADATWTRIGRTVTNALPPHGAHPFGLAFDGCPLPVYHLPDWAPQDPVWDEYGAALEAAGCAWGGRWHSPDRPHGEIPGWERMAPPGPWCSAGAACHQ